MLRSGDTVVGVALLLLVMGGLATHAVPWFVVYLFVAACCAFYLAAYGQNHYGGSFGTLALGLALIVASVVSLVRYSSSWIYWCTLIVAFGSLAAGIYGLRDRRDSSLPPRIVRT
jgi:hypothetical protein